MRGFTIGKPTTRVGVAAVSAGCAAAAVIALSGAASAGRAPVKPSWPATAHPISAAKYLKQAKTRVVAARRSPTTAHHVAATG
jgi:hypothetical protein